MSNNPNIIERLYPFQKDGVEYALSHHYSINACEMGLGKTIQAIAVMVKTGLKTIVVCPAYLKQNWVDEIKKFSNITNYEIFSYESFTKNSVSPADLIIFDEAHYLKNMTAKRTKKAHNFIKRSLPEYLLLLSGTPIKNRVTEFYSLLKLVSYNPKGTSGIPLIKSFGNFANALCDRETVYLPYGGRIFKYSGLKDRQLLLKYLKGKYFRRLASEELELPSLVYTAFPYQHVPGGKLNEELAADFDGNGGHISTAKKDMAVHKAPFTAKLVNELLEQGERPVIVFTDHIDSAKLIGEILEKQKHAVDVITGSTCSTSRINLVKNLQEKDNIDVLVCTIGSMSTGFTMTKANRIIFNDLSWCPADNDQATARIYRIGQSKTCFVSTVYCPGIDERINKTLQGKKDTLNEAL